MKNTIGIFDDHPAICEAVKSKLEKCNCKIIFQASEAEELISCISKEQPDVLILDMVAPGITGLELFKEIVKEYPKQKIIAYTSLGSPILIDNLLQLGVVGYVNKKQSLDELFEAVQEVANNKISLPEEYKFLSKKFRIVESTLLTNREIEIIKLIAQEFTSKEIADQLFLSSNTIENHRKNIFNKLKVKNIAGMMLLATRLGYIS